MSYGGTTYTYNSLYDNAPSRFFNSIFDGTSNSKLKKALEESFWSIYNGFSEFVVVLNYKKIYGKTTKQFWEGIQVWYL